MSDHVDGRLSLTHGSHFRIGNRSYRVWTNVAYRAERLMQIAADIRSNPTTARDLEPWCLSQPAFDAEQKARGHSDVHGALPQATVILGDREAARRLGDQFNALPELQWGQEVLLDGVEMRIIRGDNDHVRFARVGDLLDRLLQAMRGLVKEGAVRACLTEEDPRALRELEQLIRLGERGW